MSIQEMENLKQQKKEKLQQLEQEANLNTYPSKCFNSFCCDDDEDYTVVITPDFPITDTLIMENEHLDTIPETESDEFKKSSVENLVPIPSESEDLSNIERDTLSLERLLHDDPIPLSDTLDFDFSNVVRVFLPFFTYPIRVYLIGVELNESPMEILSSTCSRMDQ
nr:hypothetical protein [Tanacetum cinerariifolium]